MIYFDISPRIRQNISAAIFHKKPLQLAVVQRIISDMGMGWPHQIQALGVSGGPILSRLPRYSARELPGVDVAEAPRLLWLHPGIYYVFTLPDTDQTFLTGWEMVGEACLAESADKWISTIQKAVLSLRENELQVMGAFGSTSMVSKQQEQDAARQVILLARQHAANWEDAAGDWLRLCLIRHQRMLNIIRRKIIELVSSLTRLNDEDDGISFLYADLVLRIYQTHTFSELEEITMNSLRDMVTLLGAEKGCAGQSEMVNKAIRFLGDHHAEQISLSDVAEASHVSASHLARLFRMETGITVMTYLHRLRIAHAKQLLAECNDTVLSVALDCGFESPEHFHRLFKRITQTTPRRYRMDARVDRI